MTRYIETYSVASGWQYRVRIGVEFTPSGSVKKGTADYIVGGWAPTEAQAEQKAREVDI